MDALPLEAIDVTDEHSAKEAAVAISQASELAVDVEVDSMHAFSARLCFVQVATTQGIWLFDTLAPGVDIRVLSEAFGDAKTTKFFHAAGGDLTYLAEAGVRVRGLFDTHRAATLLGWPKVGLADLVLERHQITLDKGHQTADFSMRPLPEAMRAYIADDVRYLLDVGHWAQEACRTADVYAEVDLDCQRMCEEATVRPDLLGQVPKIPKGDLKANLYVLAQVLGQKLHELRLLWAQQDNVPMGRMLSNAALVGIATKAPSSIKELSHIAGVRGPFVKEHGEEVLTWVKTLVDQMRQGTIEAPHTEPAPRDPKKRKRDEALRAWRGEKASERKVTPSVILSNALIGDLAEKPPQSLQELAQTPWLGEKRVRLYGKELLELLSKLT